MLVLIDAIQFLKKTAPQGSRFVCSAVLPGQTRVSFLDLWAEKI
jgi:hypothetical protein